MTSNYQMVALDLDGTLLDEKLTISPRTIAAVRRAQDQGALIVVATGRPYESASEYVRQLGVQGPLICYQGAVIVWPDNDAEWHRWNLSPEIASILWQYAEEHGHTVVALTPLVSLCNQKSEASDFYESLHPNIPLHFGYQINDIIKFVIVQNTVASTVLFPDYQALLAGRAEVTRSHARFVEITARGVSKGKALSEIARRYKIPLPATVAIGDQLNDVSMVSIVGMGIAMGGAPEELQRIARIVAPSIRSDGAAVVLDRLFGGKSTTDLFDERHTNSIL